MKIPTHRPRYYYACQPLLAWSLAHYFFAKRHYLWVAAPFYPFKRDNPPSSDPYTIYGELYGPWFARDYFSRFVTSTRLSLRKGLKAAALTPSVERRLARCCYHVDVQFFLPLIYRVDVSAIDRVRLDASKGSAALGSDEFLIADLAEDEFDLIFYEECFDDADLSALLAGGLDARDVLETLERRIAAPSP